MNNESLFENSQLTVSYELLQFLRWIVITEPEALSALMHQAYESGFMDQESPKQQGIYVPSNEELQRNVVDFFDLLEQKLHEASMNTESESQLAEKAFRPAVNHIDSSLCDDDIVALSVAQASSQLRLTNPQNAKETLYKELLKNWRPRNKHCLH